jgi:hypothetical protein
MTVLLPDIGRNGIVNSVRRLSGLNNPGYREVDASADFVAGMIAKLEASSNGNAVLKVSNATDTNILGIFYCHKTTSFYRPVVDEEQTYGTSPNTSWAVYLNHSNLKDGSVKVTNEAGDTTYTVTTDYTVNNTNGVVTRTSTGAIGATDTIKLAYMYEDPNLSGIDQTLGSGMAATLEDHGEMATLIYDTSKAYTLMGSLYCNASGYLTSTNGGGSVVGKCTKVPTAEDNELRFKLTV